MKGLELAKAYFEEFGKPMLENDFPDLLDKIAVGFVGSGSEKFGFDDDVSTDHDFEPGFCIFIPDDIESKREFALERAYAKLPKEYKGYKRQILAPVGGNRDGVIHTSQFYKEKVGVKNGELSVEEWLFIPEYSLAEATNGEVFFDNYGEFSRIRNNLKNMPKDVMLKRLAGNLLIMAQAGQYNYLRCLKHGEVEAAALSCVEFVKATMNVVFLLNGKYMPYYKWSFRALKDIERTEQLYEQLSFLLQGDNGDKTVADFKYDVIESIAGDVISVLQERGLTKAICGDLEKHAYSVNDGINDANIRNMNVLVAV